MEITYLGHACFKLKNKTMTVIIDPYHAEVGLTLGKQKADLVLISHDHSDHNAAELISGTNEGSKPMVINTAGEYEIGGVSVFGVESSHGGDKGTNIIFNVLIDGISVCHLGDLGQEQLTEEQIKRIGEVDILLSPVGGHYSLSAKQALAIMNQLEPKYMIPMHYRTPLHNEEMFGMLADLKQFTNEAGIAPAPVTKLDVNKDKLPEESTIVIFE